MTTASGEPVDPAAGAAPLARGVLVAAATDGIGEEEVAALEHFLGEGQIPRELNPDALREDLDRRIEFALDRVPPLKCAQVIRDLCVIAMADGRADEEELAVIREIAEALHVDPMVVEQTLNEASCGLD